MTKRIDFLGSPPRKPLAVPLVSVALGVLMFMTSWLAADAPGVGLSMLLIMVLYAAFLHFGQCFELAQLMGRGKPVDERHQWIEFRAMQAAYLAVITVAVAGFFWEVAQGDAGAFTLICTVGGAAHILATMVYRARA